MLGAASTLRAQAVVGELCGTVASAASGSPIARAEVLIVARDTTRTFTDARGVWCSPPVLAAEYTIFARALGFQTATAQADTRAGTVGVLSLSLTPLALPLDAVVVTAARREQKLKDVIVATEVIGRAEIQRSGASDLSDVLTEQTGLEFLGGHPAGAGVMMQGIGSERVLVLLDGQPIAGRIAGEFDVSRIPTSVIEQIEIVKGPQAVLYGSDAMGGVINVITRAANVEGFRVSGRATAGTQSRKDAAVGAELGIGAAGIRVDLGRRSMGATPGRSETVGALAERNDLSANFQWSPGSGTAVEAVVLALDERQRWASGGIYNFADNEQWSGRITGRYRAFTALLHGSVFDHLSRASTQPLPIAGDTGQRQVQRVFQGEVSYSARLGDRDAHALDVGVQLRRDETRSVRIPGGARALNTIEPLAQLEVMAAEDLGLSAGIRLSRSNQWGTHVTPRLALRYRPANAITLRASTGTGFRAPDFRELYMFFVNDGVGYSVRGNPELRPEHSRNVSVGVEVNGGVAFGRVQLYWNEFRDFIETRPVSGPGEPPIFLYQNVDDGFTRGADIEGGGNFAGLRVEAGASLLDTKDRTTGRPLLGRPGHSARFSASHELPLGFRLSTTTLFTGRTPMQSDSTGMVSSWRDPFLRVDVRAARSLIRDVELVLGADNVFDRRPAEWAGLTRRHVYTAISW